VVRVMPLMTDVLHTRLRRGWLAVAPRSRLKYNGWTAELLGSRLCRNANPVGGCARLKQDGVVKLNPFEACVQKDLGTMYRLDSEDN
jgi:hypothetical protein